MTTADSAALPPVPTTPLDIQWSGMTHIGRVRPNNEDAFLALSGDAREVRFLGKIGRGSLVQADFVFAVSDGMGGAKSGEFASRIAVDRITRLFLRAFRRSGTGEHASFTDLFGELFASIHGDLLKLGFSYEECAGMGATLTLCWFTRKQMHFGHVGDSRLYHVPPAGDLVQLTQDHSHVGWLRRKGDLNEREARTHPRKNSLQQALGAGHQFVEPQMGAVDYHPGDQFLICSDGLIDGLWDRQIEEVLRTPAPPDSVASPAQRLVEQAVDNSGRDNSTAVVVQVLAP